MQNKILIIGNGFDLYHKLPTRYTDFLFFASHWGEFKTKYEEQCSMVEDLPTDGIAVSLGENGELVSSSLMDFADHASLFDKDHIEYLDQNLRSNAWIKYFNKVHISGKNWIDFEAEIHRALKQVELYYSQLLPAVDNDVPMKIMPDLMRDVVYTFSEKTGHEYKNLAANIFRRKDKDPEVLHPNKELLLNTMKGELDALNKCLDYYLLDFVSLIHCESYSEQIKALGDIYLLNFNYTYTYAAVYGKQSLIEHHPIHGEAKEENMVLGIPDESFPETLDYVYFQKYFQRIQKRTGNFYKGWICKPEYSSLEDMPAEVYIMGHSLNKVDKGVLQDFFFEDNVKLIKIYYHSQSGYESQVINLVDMFGKDFIIQQTSIGRIVFEELKPAISGSPRVSA